MSKSAGTQLFWPFRQGPLLESPDLGIKETMLVKIKEEGISTKNDRITLWFWRLPTRKALVQKHIPLREG